MAMGMLRSGFATSSAMWVAQSRHMKTQFVLIRPTMKAIPSCFQPVVLIKVANTNLAFWWVGALAGTVIRMTRNETIETKRVKVAIFGRALPKQLKNHAKRLMTS